METEKKKIIEALNNDKFLWRTIQGISKETKIDPDLIKSVMRANTEVIVQSTSCNDKGEALFTTREKLRKEGGTLKRLSSALINRGG